MMVLGFILILFLVKTTRPFSMRQIVDSINIETNTLEITVTNFSGNITNPNYSVTFSTQFLSNPKILTHIRGLFNCFPQKNQFFNIRYSIKSSTLLGCVLESRISLVRGYDPAIKIKVYYLVVEDKSTDIYANYYSKTDINMPNFTYVINLSFTDSKQDTYQNPTTYLGCFLSGIYCRQATSTFVFKNYCTKTGNSTITFHTQTTAVTPSGCDRYDVYFSSIVIFRSSTRHSLEFGTLSATPSSSPVLAFSSTEANTVFVIGLASFQTPDACLQFQLKDSNTQIDLTYNNFIQLDFNYVQLKYIADNPTVMFRTFQFQPFRDQVIYYFQKLSFYMLLYTSKSNVFSSTFKFNTRSGDYAYCDILTPIPDYEVSYEFYLMGNKYNYKITVSGIIINSHMMKIDVNNRILSVYLANTNKSSTTRNITLSDGVGVTTKELINLNSSTTLVNFEFTNSNILGNAFSFFYRSQAHNYNKTLIQLYSMTITQLSFSVMSPTYRAVVEGIPDSESVTQAQFTWSPTGTFNHRLAYQQVKRLELAFEHEFKDGNNSELEFKFTTNTKSLYQVYFKFKFLVLKNIDVLDYKKQCRLTLVNVNKNPDLSQFQILQSSDLTKESIETQGNYTILTLNYSSEVIQNSFSLQYSPKLSHLTSTVNDIRIPYFSTKSNDIPQLIIILKDQQNLITNISLVDSPLEILNKTREQNDTIQLTLPSEEELHGTILKIRMNYNTTTSYHSLLHLQLDTLLCTGDFTIQSSQYFYVASIIVCMYWIVFVIGMVFCQKIYVVETMFALQFAYLSYIPLGNYCQPFASLSVLKYSFGWNNLPIEVFQTPISFYYSSLGFQSNFISNVNFMLMLLLVFPIFSPIFLILGARSRGYRAKPRLLAAGKSLLLDIPLTIILFNTPNIISSFVISMQTFGATNVPSFAVSSASVSIIFIGIVLFLIFQKHFRQYRVQFCDRLQLCRISIEKSTKIRRLYPLILFFQMMTISAVLSLKSLLDVSLYLTFGILILTSFIKIILAPYNHGLDNARLFVHGFLLIVINGLQIGFKVLQMQPKSEYNTIYQYPWAILVIIMIIIAGNTLPYLIYKITIWLRSRGLIDVSLYNQTQPVPIKPIYKMKDHLDSQQVTYPALEFSMYKHHKERMVESRQQLLKINQINKQKSSPKQKIDWKYSLL